MLISMWFWDIYHQKDKKKLEGKLLDIVQALVVYLNPRDFRPTPCKPMPEKHEP